MSDNQAVRKATAISVYQPVRNAITMGGSRQVLPRREV